jgi:DNA-binding CsgD family transcriptional regulator
MFDSEPPSAPHSTPTSHHTTTRARLDPREIAVLGYALRGDSLKLAGLEMGLSTAMVWRLRKSALDKVGCDSVFEFLRAVAEGRVSDFAPQPPPSSSPRSGVWRMTRAEREIAAHVMNGHSNASIARRRGTSSRTVANQLAALYRKLRVGSRTELAARLSRQLVPGVSAGWR